ncbi:hypothetical protein NEFER03_0829 [Nematocida sp. LUAm3]|nr:hypothetical protein NEFER03_0829 [Nematocida sp. LUAm3]KAI5174847.1 hypothetical protein NEFER02_0947 [Nematocida sp. LUAm2]KAI5177555.1 hypothetical protein NEFER01_0805 [Nematocida sp. LUAm1]
MLHSTMGYVHRILYTCMLLAASAACVSENSAKERDLARMAGFLVFMAPSTLSSSLFITYTQKLSSSRAVSIIKDIVKENSKILQKITKNDKSFSSALISHLHVLEKEYDRTTPKKNRFFEMDTSTQASAMQKKEVEEHIYMLNEKFAEEDMYILSIYIIKLLNISKSDKKKVWKAYSEIFMKVERAMSYQTSVASAISSSKNEFYAAIEKLLIHPEINMKEFHLERAKLNLGGAIYSPGLLIQLALNISDSDKEAFIRKLITSLLAPIYILKKEVASLSDEDAKEHILKYINASIGTLQVFSLNKEINDAYNIRSDFICRSTKNMKYKNEISTEIDRIQVRNSNRMLSVLQLAPSSLFKDFIILEKSLASTYIDIALSQGEGSRKKQELIGKFELL